MAQVLNVDASVPDANEERFRLVAQLSSDGVWDWNLLTHHIWWSDGMTTLFGYPVSDNIADPNWWRDHVHEDDREAVITSIHEVINNPDKEWWQAEYRFLTAWGHYVDVYDRGRVIRDHMGRGMRMVGAMKDLCAEQMHQAEYTHLADSIPQIVWTATDEGTVTYFNQHWYAYTGLSREISLSEARWQHAYHPDDLPRLIACREQARLSGSHFEAEFRIRRHDGEYRWFLARGRPLVDRSGKILRWAGTLTDVHDKNLIEHELKEAVAQARGAHQAKTEFLTHMSHEIRTPINAIVGLANLLSETRGLSPKQQEFISTLKVSSEQLLELINDLLDASQLEANHLQLETIPFNLNQVVEEVVRINAVHAQGKMIHLGVRGQCHQMLVGDPVRLKQVLMNLVGNAVKFTEEGSVNINIFAAPQAQGAFVDLMIAVEDTGIGIPESRLKDIFGKFSQAESSTHRRFGGSGLGLNIAKTLVELMGGTLRVNSTLGKGSCFTVMVALTTTAAITEPTVLPPKKRKEAMSNMPLSTDAPKVLLVEDYHANVLVATMLLSQYGYDYVLAENGSQALEKTAQHDFDIVLMDVEMPDMNGFQATAAIRAREAAKGKRTTIIGMTAHALKGDRERCLEAGMDDYIAKPFRPESLKEILERHCPVRVA